SYAELSAAEADVLIVNDVNEVLNKLEVRFPENYEMPGDDKLEEVINKTLKWTSGINSENIDVAVENNLVVLEGSVDSLWKKTEAEKIAGTLHGVSGVTNKIAVVPTNNLEDEIIAEDIENALARSFYIDSNNLDIIVENGQVTISGIVSSRRAFIEAESIASYTKGVKNVDNDIVINPQLNV
ncbi:MAG: BON domain-containing protein, partial [bacterium]